MLIQNNYNSTGKRVRVIELFYYNIFCPIRELPLRGVYYVLLCHRGRSVLGFYNHFYQFEYDDSTFVYSPVLGMQNAYWVGLKWSDCEMKERLEEFATITGRIDIVEWTSNRKINYYEYLIVLFRSYNAFRSSFLRSLSSISTFKRNTYELRVKPFDYIPRDFRGLTYLELNNLYC